MKLLINLLLLVLICFSCSKEEGNEYEPYLKGSIIGYAMMTDQYGYLLDDHSEITVYTEPGRKFSGKTDIKGRFEIEGVPTGTYNLSCEKEGFGTMRYPEVQHLGGKPTILGMPTTEFPYWNKIFMHGDITLQITNMTIFQEDRIKIDVPYFGTPLVDNLYIRLFFSTSDGFSIEDAGYITNIRVYDTEGYFDLPDLPFESGTTVYCKGSLFTSGMNHSQWDGFSVIDSYIDEALGITVYPNITEESDQYEFVLP
jgi:hypothetical protein